MMLTIPQHAPLYDVQLSTMMETKDRDSRNVIALAAAIGDKSTFDSVITAAKNVLSSPEVRHRPFLKD